MISPERQKEWETVMADTVGSIKEALEILFEKTDATRQRVEALEEENDRLRRRVEVLEQRGEDDNPSYTYTGPSKPKSVSERYPDLTRGEVKVVEAIEEKGITRLGRNEFIELVKIHAGITRQSTIKQYMRSIVKCGALDMQTTRRGSAVWVYPGRSEK